MTDEVKDSAQETTNADATQSETATESKPEAAESKTETTEVPAEYTLTIPDGSLLPEKDIERIKAQAKELGFSNDEAQEVLDISNEAAKNYNEHLMGEIEAQRNAWVEAAKADKEIAGANGADFAKNVELAKRVIDKYGTDGLKKELDATGFGNHPEVLRIFVKIGKLIANDEMVNGGDTKKPAQPKTAAEKMYPKHFPSTN